MAGKLQDKVIIVTGGSTGIGRATALRCAADGAKVVVADVNTVDASATVEVLVKAGGIGKFVKTNVAIASEVQALITETVSAYGRLDGAFNNAGIEGDFCNITKMSEESFDRTIAINLKGVWLCVKAQIEQLLSQGSGGSIVNTASVAGLVGARGATAYCASKHGVVGITKSAALEFARKRIRVNAVCPGVIKTGMVERLLNESKMEQSALVAQEPMDRLGEPREIADAVAWLLSDEASFVTGVAMPVDGGYAAQ
ncbi:MAG: glucose 1-dehydrogenase [Gammaproteobacteria bacterium]|nr:glucose 1-dehydrogenase [Gammaproteobacteria bacterium]